MADPSPANPSGMAASGLAESDALRRLRRREISLDEYLDICVEGAVRHLVEVASPEKLDAVKAMLRNRLATDAVLVEYVRQATGLDSRTASGK